MEKYEVLKKQEESRRPGNAILLCSVAQLCLTLCDPMEATRLLCPWNFPGKNTGVGCQALLKGIISCLYSVQFSCSVVSDSLRSHELQHARAPCPSPTPGVYPNSCPLSLWCRLTISSSVIPFSSYFQSFPTSASFEMSQLFASGGQNIGVSASKSVLPMNTQDWFPLGWTSWISLQSKGLSRVFSNNHNSNA